MSWDLKKIAVCSTLISMCGVAAGYGCPAVVDSIWELAIDTAHTSITASIGSMTSAITAANVKNMQRIDGALRIATKQTSISADKEITTDTNVKQAIAMAAADASTRKAVFNAVMDFNPATGQGVDPSGELARSHTLAVSIGEANTDLQEKVLREVDNAPGSFVADQGGALAKRVAASKANYCTADEVKAGVCAAVGPYAGRDVDAANFFTSAVTGSGESAAKSTMLNHMYGIPYAALDKTALGSGSGKSFLEAKRTEDAFRSVSQASFKAIQAWTESRGTPGNPQPSVLDALLQKVDVYSGGNNYDAWEQGQASQSERGLLVQYAKMSATELYLLHAQYQQMERVEANVSALFALRARSNGKVEVASSNARTAAAQGKVK